MSLIFFKIALLLPFSKFKFLFEHISKLPICSSHRQELIVQYVKSVGKILPFGFTCLPQALTVKFLLRNQKDIIIKIGILRETTSFQSHAWVEKNHQTIIGESDKNYTPIWNWS
ncbi:MAG: lasso peptide biosynthesis B2 protein [Pseudarcicella sp.]|nr:lasso peptide biosynthesis B2 protein [Pseudarcicella sp.]MBP6411433.1 lasso peptide biosynthesis B2 protein [Pseudarcicella sp.]